MSISLNCLNQLWKCRSGTAAVEFAIIAPVMALIFIGTIEITNLIRLQAKMNVAAGQLAEMIASRSVVTEGSAEGPGGTLGDICTGATYNLLPYGSTYVWAWVESTTVNSSGSTGQDWANDTSCPLAYRAGSFTETITLTNIADSPRSMFTSDGTPRGSSNTGVPGYTAISVEMGDVYVNVFPFFASTYIGLTATGVARPRANKAPTCTYPSGSGTAPCPGYY